MAACTEKAISSGATEGRFDWPFAAAAGALLLGLLLAYSNHFDNGFHFDDVHTIVHNPAIRDLNNAASFFTDATTFSVSPPNQGYRPLVTLSLALDYALGGGLDLRAFHTSQFVLLIATGALLVRLYHTLLTATAPHPWNGYAALLGAALFCIHTANSETVNYLIARCDMLSTLGVIVAFVLYIRQPAWRRSYLFLVPVFLGALAKPPAVMFAPLLLVYVLFFEAELSVADLCRRRGLMRALPHLIRCVPVFVACGLMFMLTDTAGATGSLLSDHGIPFTRREYFVTELTAYAHYLRLFVLPIGLLADTTQPALASVLDRRVLWGILILGALGVSACWASRRRDTRLTAFGLAWFVLALVPTSSVFPLSQVYSEHRLFFPYVGLMMVVVSVAMHWVRAGGEPATQRWRARQALLLAVITFCGLGIGTYRRNRVWQSEETLWGDIADKEPHNWRAFSNYAMAVADSGNPQRAVELLREAIRLNPSHVSAHLNAATYEGQLGNFQGAEQHLQQAVRLDDDNPAVHYAYALFLLQRGRVAEATTEADHAVRLDAPAVRGFMREECRRADTVEFCILLSQSLTRIAGQPAAETAQEQTIMKAGMDALYAKHDPAAAAALFGQVLERNPTHYTASYQLAAALDQAGEQDKAALVWERVLIMAKGYQDHALVDTARTRLHRPE